MTFFFCFVFFYTQLAELGQLQISSVAGELNGKSPALLGAAQCQPLVAAVPLKETSWDDPYLYGLHRQIHLSNSAWLRQRNTHFWGTTNLTHFSCLLEVKMNYTLKATIYFY